jgi:hypothetical protein
MVEPVSIYRQKDLRQARVFAEDLRLQLQAPASAVTDAVVEGLADMLQQDRLWQQNAEARFRARIVALRSELDADVARLRAMMDAAEIRHRTALDAAEAFVKARKALKAALAELPVCSGRAEQPSRGAN